MTAMTREDEGLGRLIRIRGARQHNLKNIDLDLPKDSLIVVTGVSGSGKSTLAFDVLHAEGCRRYLDAFLPASRFVFGAPWRQERPDVDVIEGLSPTVAIQHRRLPADPRSTVGTVTEISDFLRILYARLGTVTCPACRVPIRAHTIPEMVQEVQRLPEKSRLLVLAPLAPVTAADLGKTLVRLRREGFARVRFEGRVHLLDPLPTLPRRSTYDLQVVVDRLVVTRDAARRLADSLELAAQLGRGTAGVAVLDGGEVYFSQNRVCGRCGWEAPEPTPQLFSHFHPEGACPSCQGLGYGQKAKPARGKSSAEEAPHWEGEPCGSCKGSRLNQRALSVLLDGCSFGEAGALDLPAFRRWMENLSVEPAKEAVASGPRREILRRVDALLDLGLDYLHIGRGAGTLSSGEAQRLRLAQQLNTPLSGVLYLLDEPSVGLHARDRERLLRTLFRFRDAGNTVLLVEHDLEVLRWADHVVDLGPGGGTEGGRVLYSGPPEGIVRCEASLTGRYAGGAKKLGFERVSSWAAQGPGVLRLTGAKGRNLKNVSVAFPLGRLTCVTGVSGSGKTSLVRDTLYPAVRNRLHRGNMPELPYNGLEGWEDLQGVFRIDQAPIGTTSRSTPGTYTGVFDLLRNLFGNLPEAKARGYRAERFSFNTKGGRCEACQGEGRQRIDMVLLPDVFMTCPACGGSRYEEATLEIRFKGYSIADVLHMTVAQALEVFQNLPAIRNRLQILSDVGLHYLQLGQPGNTLSGGEAQRVRLARELGRRVKGQTLYILDEPTRGLHIHDVERLLWILRRLVQQGHTVIVVEHHVPFIGCADHVIDLGPEGGPEGGRVVAEGPPRVLAEKGGSHTARALARFFRSL
ncbi:MAG: uvrA [Desulfacinum sp.]|jgi:excinuclease ABC subunit A|nr:uvrA [Desulfacinum sp.]